MTDLIQAEINADENSKSKADMQRKQASGRLGVCGDDIIPVGYFQTPKEGQKLENMILI